jgi:hypothetical protein
MLTYKAIYKFLNEGVHAEVIDFPGTITFGRTWKEAPSYWQVHWSIWQKQTCFGGAITPARSDIH